MWDALLATVDASFGRRGSSAYARLVGCADWAAGGPRPLGVGSTIPGFRVAAAVPHRELLLEGRHRFSAYALVFRIEPAGAGRSQLRAESRAQFRGASGQMYRLLVLRTGAHVAGVRGLLAAVRRRAEHRS